APFRPRRRRPRRENTKRMLYKSHTPMELGDTALGQITFALVFVLDHMIPAVHKVLSWETEDVDLGPIIPVCRSIIELIRRKCIALKVFFFKSTRNGVAPLCQPQAEANCLQCNLRLIRPSYREAHPALPLLSNLLLSYSDCASNASAAINQLSRLYSTTSPLIYEQVTFYSPGCSLVEI
ncbi:hypothetical protein L915_20030, partial [Phytophthora nicotianae]